MWKTRRAKTPETAETTCIANLDGLDTGSLTLHGYVKKTKDGRYVGVASDRLSDTELRFMEARRRAIERLDILSKPGSAGCYAFFDRDVRPTTRKIDELAAELLIPEQEIKSAFAGLVIPVSTSVAKSLNLPLRPVRIRLRQLGLYGKCIDAQSNEIF